MPSVNAWDAQLAKLNGDAQAFLARNPGTRGGEFDVTWGFDPTVGAYYRTQAGGREGGQRRYENTTMPGSTTGASVPQGGGLVHGRPEFDQKTGRWKTPLDWGKALTWGVGAGIGAGALAASPLFASAAAPGGFSAATGGAPATMALGTTTGVGAAPIAASTAAGAASKMGWSSILNSPLFSQIPSGALGLYGAHQQAESSDRAAQLQYQGIQEALALERERDAQAKAQYESAQARRAPYRQVSAQALQRLTQLLGIPGPTGRV